ncbi:MAG: hypothetical protein JST89_17600 [Cyanobacteria bacterium SZAS-4]|nr:hypothetical protein [Cyanobacteria bacterium SZAS-4]
MASPQRAINLKSLSAAILLPLIVLPLLFGLWATTTAGTEQFGADSTVSTRFASGLIFGIFFVGIEGGIVASTIYIFIALRNAGRLSRKFYSFAAPAFLLSFLIVTAIGIGFAYDEKYVHSTDPEMSNSDFGTRILLSAYCGATIGSLALSILMLCCRLKTPLVQELRANDFNELDSKGQ